MITTSTNSSKTVSSIENECSAEGLGEDDEVFYGSLRNALNKLTKEPRSETIEAILKHSRTL